MTVSASVTANHPINPKVGVFYFEITIDHFKGNSALSIGIASKSLRKNFQVGKLFAFCYSGYLYQIVWIALSLSHTAVSSNTS